jgi:signal peptidase I
MYKVGIALFLCFLTPAMAITATRTGSGGMLLKCTNSMYPTFTCNSNLTLEFVGYSHNFKVGDIVAYSPTIEQRFTGKQKGFIVTATYILHRIIGNINGTYILKGDNNDFLDNDYYGNIKEYQIRYKVI